MSSSKHKQAPSTIWKAALPPTFYDTTTPGSCTTRPYYLFPLFILINIITMADRAIIPGASQEFLAFMEGAFDAPNLVKENPDAGLVSLITNDVLILCAPLYLSFVFMNSI